MQTANQQALLKELEQLLVSKYQFATEHTVLTLAATGKRLGGSDCTAVTYARIPRDRTWDRESRVCLVDALQGAPCYSRSR